MSHSYQTTPKCPDCGEETTITRTRMDGQGDGIYLRCKSELHEQFVRLDDLPELMQRAYARDGADLPRARQDEYMKGAEIAVREIRASVATLKRLHVPLDEL